jgi:ribosomal protein L11 methylase PrmA
MVRAVPGSFRDPAGRVYEVNGQIFRTVIESYAADFEYVNSIGLLDRLAADGLVLPSQQVERDILGPFHKDAKYVLQVPKLPFISFPYEWSFAALKAAALLHLKIHLAALDQSVTLSDASAYNIQFRGPHPVFIDHLSFRRYKPGEIWVGHRQFCEQFLVPLFLQAFFGISHNHWYRGALEGITANEFCRLLKWRHYLSWNVLTHVVMPSVFQRMTLSSEVEKATADCSFPLASFRRMLQNLQDWIHKLQPADLRETVWRDYAKANSYHPQEVEIKRRLVGEFISHTNPQLLWDLGCNTGDYAKVALEAGASYVVGLDFDHGALEIGFARAHEENLAFQTLYMDAANPAPSQGWMELERPSLRDRASADGILALAFLHHLTIAKNIPFSQLLDWIVDLAPTGIIEFIPKSDPMVQRLLRTREDIFSDYSREFFLSHLSRRSEIVKTQSLEPSGRLLVWYRRCHTS